MKDPTFNKHVTFKLIKMPCCQHELDWISNRIPNYCPECGRRAYSLLRGGHSFLISDDNAILQIHQSAIEPF